MTQGRPTYLDVPPRGPSFPPAKKTWKPFKVSYSGAGENNTTEEPYSGRQGQGAATFPSRLVLLRLEGAVGG